MDIQKVKKIKVDWLGKCPKCERTEHTVSTVEGNKSYLYDGDIVECWCGQTGVIDVDGIGSAWCKWNEKPRTIIDDFNDYYREKFPNYWNVLHKNNHQACTHYFDLLNAWQVAKADAVPEGFVLVPKERLAKAVDGIEALFKEDCTLALGELLPIQQDLNAMIEAQEQGDG